MRVLVVTNMYPYEAAPYYGIFVKEQVEALWRLGVEIDVEAHLGRISKWRYLTGLRSLVGRLRGGRYDLIHSHHTYSTIMALAARRLSGKCLPIVQTFHEGEVLDPQRGRRRHLRSSMRLKAFALRRVDAVIPVERRMLGAVLGAEAERIPSQVIPPGVDLDRFNVEDPREARRRLGWSGEGPFIFFPYAPGKPAKRHDLAQAAFERFRAGHPEAKLIIGGQIPHDQMPATIRASDVLLILTDYEASPMIVKEALASERPIVATDVGDIREYFGDLSGVLLTDGRADNTAAKLDQAIEIVARDAFGGRERLRELELGVDQSAGRVFAVYEGLLRGSSGL